MTRKEQLQTLASRFVERANALHYRGRRRDDAALDYFLGAATGASIAGDETLALALGNLTGLVLSLRGYAEVERLAKGEE